MIRFPTTHRPTRNERIEQAVAMLGVLTIYVVIMLAVLAILHFATQPAGGANPATEPMPMPMVIVSAWDGAFHAGEYPGAQPYVRIGTEVTPDTVVGQIDAMMLVPVKAGVAGTITDILVTDGEMVEAGQTLMIVRPPLPPI